LRGQLNEGLADKLREVLRENPDTKVTMYLTPHSILQAIADAGAVDLVRSIKTFREFLSKLSDKQRQRVEIYCHPGAVSLSCLVRDRIDKHRAVLVLTPRWATDITIERRFFCVIERREHRDLFDAIVGGIPHPEYRRLSLDEMVAELSAQGIQVE
jgi:hypothetical protein